MVERKACAGQSQLTAFRNERHTRESQYSSVRRLNKSKGAHDANPEASTTHQAFIPTASVVIIVVTAVAAVVRGGAVTVASVAWGIVVCWPARRRAAAVAPVAREGGEIALGPRRLWSKRAEHISGYGMRSRSNVK